MTLLFFFEDEKETKHLETLEGVESRLHLFQINLFNYNSIIVVDQTLRSENAFTFLFAHVSSISLLSIRCVVHMCLGVMAEGAIDSLNL